MRDPVVNSDMSAFVTNIMGWSVSCKTQFTTTSYSASTSWMGTTPSERCTTARVGSTVECSMRSNTIPEIGSATAVTTRLVRTVISEIPNACRAVTAPRAVLPKPMTTARSRCP